MNGEAQQILRGSCLCGACGFELIGPPNWIGHCHCNSCRRATASPFTTWIGQPNGFWKFTKDEPAVYQSSPGNLRGFCGTCGSPMFYRSERYENETHFYASLLDNPGLIQPQAHYHADEILPWVHLSDELPKK